MLVNPQIQAMSVFLSERLLRRHGDVSQVDWNNGRRGLISEINFVVERNVSYFGRV